MRLDFGILVMAKPDPTKDPEFRRVLGNLLKAGHEAWAQYKTEKEGDQKEGLGCLFGNGDQLHVQGI
jgi:hypothetical protein